MANGNPFSLTFSKIPSTSIDRLVEKKAIVDDFLDASPVSQIYLISGVRGSGKTVFMASVKEQLRFEEDWIVIDLSSSEDLISELAAALYDQEHLHHLFLKAKLDLSVLGIGLGIEGAAPVSSINVALDRMLRTVKKAGKRVLITIDEATNRARLKEFTLSFSGWMQNGYPIFLLMTGLPESISGLQTAKGQTFLLRSPKIYLSPLNMTLITKAYMEIFKIFRTEAEEMALQVNGYSYAFQLLGSLLWDERRKNKNATYRDILDMYDAILASSAYNQIWSDLSDKDQEILRAIAALQNVQDVSKIREYLGIESSQLFHRYKKRLIDRCIITEAGYAKITFTLPRFKEYINNQFIY